MKDFFSDIFTGLTVFTVVISGMISTVAFVAWFSYGVESNKILYVSLPILMVTLPLMLRRKAYFDFLLVWLIGPALVGLLVISLKAIDSFFF